MGQPRNQTNAQTGLMRILELLSEHLEVSVYFHDMIACVPDFCRSWTVILGHIVRAPSYITLSAHKRCTVAYASRYQHLTYVARA